MTEQYNGEECNQTLVLTHAHAQEICLLKNKVSVLSHKLNESHVLNTNLSNQLVKLESCIEQIKCMRFPFDEYYFRKNPTVDYLTMCDLSGDDVEELLNMLPKLDFPCTKYLIDRWIEGWHKWNEKFYDDVSNNNKILIQFVCKYGCKEAVLYILDIYVEKNLNLEHKTKNGWLPIHLLCRHGTPRTIKRIIDIYVEKQISLRNKRLGTHLKNNSCLRNNDVMYMYLNNQYVDFYK